MHCYALCLDVRTINSKINSKKRKQKKKKNKSKCIVQRNIEYVSVAKGGNGRGRVEIQPRGDARKRHGIVSSMYYGIV